MDRRRIGGRGRRAADWLGNPVSCADCPNEETRAAGRCEFGRACVMDRRARRIDRFFAANPAHAERHLDASLFRGAHARRALRLALPADRAPRTTRSRTSARWSRLRLPVARLRAADERSRAQGAHRARPAPLGRGARAPVRRSGLFGPARGGAAGRAGAAGAADRRSRSVGAARGRLARARLCRCPRMTGDPDPLVQDRGRRAAAGGAARADGEGRGFSRPLRLRRTAAGRASRRALRRRGRGRARGGVGRAGRRRARDGTGPRSRRSRFATRRCSCPARRSASLKYIRNDGTYRGREIGDILVRKGEVGYVRDIGTFLQQFYIYAVEWVDSGNHRRHARQGARRVSIARTRLRP